MQPGWKERHPFTLGQRVYARFGTAEWSAHGDHPRTVTLRGEDQFGCWIALNEDWQRVDVKLYGAAPDGDRAAAPAIAEVA